MIKLGDYNKMTVVKEVDFGLYLDGGDEGGIVVEAFIAPLGGVFGCTLLREQTHLLEICGSLGSGCSVRKRRGDEGGLG